MSRRRSTAKREIIPDYKYSSVVVTKFVNALMERGKKALAQKILYSAIDFLAEKTAKEPLEGFLEVLENVKPKLEVKSRRVGGATYQVPMDVKPARAQALAIRWLINGALSRSEKTMEDRLGGEFLDAFNQKGAAMKKREDAHKMAEANRAFSHYRW